MKFIQLAVILGALSLTACAGDSAKKNSDTASKRESLATRDRCPPGYLLDEFSHKCVEQRQTLRRTPARDTLGRALESPMPDFSFPTTGGLLGR